MDPLVLHNVPVYLTQVGPVAGGRERGGRERGGGEREMGGERWRERSLLD